MNMHVPSHASGALISLTFIILHTLPRITCLLVKGIQDRMATRDEINQWITFGTTEPDTAIFSQSVSSDLRFYNMTVCR